MAALRPLTIHLQKSPNSLSLNWVLDNVRLGNFHPVPSGETVLVIAQKHDLFAY